MVLEGFLMKQGEGGLKTWKRRWFSVKQGNGVPGRRPHLYYYDKKDESNVKGKIDLTEVISVTRTTADLLSKAERGGHEFNITIPRRVYKLRAASEEDMMRWVEGLRDIQARAPPGELLGGEDGSDGEKRLSFRHSMKSKFKRMTGIEDESGNFRQPSQRQTVDLSQLNLALREEAPKKTTESPADSVSPRAGSPETDSQQQSAEPKNQSLNKMGAAIDDLASRGSPARASTMSGGEPPKPRMTMTDVGMAQSTGDLSNLDLSYITNEVSSSPKATQASQRPPAEAEEKKDEHSSLPKVTIDAWMTDNEDRETYTLRKKLAEALGVIDEKQNEIRQLQLSLDKCHKELEAAAVARETEVAIDHDKKRREAELNAVNDKLEVERRQRREMEARYTEVKTELALLKKNLHLTSKVPSLVPDAPAPVPVAHASPPASPARPRVQITEPPPRTTEPVRSLGAKPQQPAMKRDSVLQKSMSMSSMAAVQNPGGTQRRAPWMEDYLVKSCPLCNKDFGLFNRRHHCRNCGNIYCGPCSMYKCRVPGYKRPERVCDQCADAIRSKRGDGGGGGGAPRARPKSTFMPSPQAGLGQAATSQRRNSDMVSAYGEQQQWAQQQRMEPPMLQASSGSVEVLSFD